MEQRHSISIILIIFVTQSIFMGPVKARYRPYSKSTLSQDGKFGNRTKEQQLARNGKSKYFSIDIIALALKMQSL